MKDLVIAKQRLGEQLEFIREIDKIKGIFRQTYLLDESRKENDAEHSWHLAVMAMLLGEHAEVEDIDVARTIQMVLIHDLVEIDAGDTYVYDESGIQDKEIREQQAADRIFSLLPKDQCKFIRSLWDEFEARETPEAKFAGSLDRIQPLMHNYFTGGRSWLEHGICRQQVVDRNAYIAEGSQSLWEFALAMIDDAVERGYLLP